MLNAALSFVWHDGGVPEADFAETDAPVKQGQLSQEGNGSRLATGELPKLFARLKVLSEFGPRLGRPNVDTLNGSSFPNVKRLDFGRTDCGGSPLHSTAFNRPLCLSEGTRRVKTRPGFITTLSR